ncbi:AP-1 complex subunit gamma [Diplonema papillatum]|nr:AP-1 complex subunit gamma [Diplonema papillatum]KAJ9469746.1 AP-1 complex subunit gamma [Diplonema papillatum]
MSCKLKDLIRGVRNAKTAADERAVIAKECAAIRTAFKEGKDQYRCRNVSKLVYIHLLGHPTEFGQMECIRLMTGEQFVEKRIGYLALSLLVDETSDVLTLVENHFKLDLANNQEHVQALALGAIANLAGEDMARGMGNQVERFLDHNSPNLRKKAFLAMLRIVRKVPSMTDFLPKLTNILSEKSHGVVISALALIVQTLETEDGKEHIPAFRAKLPLAVTTLKQLIMNPYGAEYEVQGIVDPFLQVKLLQFLRVIGTGDEAASCAMNDVLAQIATNTEKGAVGDAIRYECCNTIIAIESDSNLRVLGVNILAKFLATRDNNTRYVALNTLTKVVEKDFQAVQQHKNTIVDCLMDIDVSIRRRALDLIYSLVNAHNIRLLVPDLINYLSFADSEFKEDLTTKICTASERYAPSSQWHVDILTEVVILAGPHAPETAANKLIALITQSEPEMQCLSIDKLWGEASGTLDGALLAKESLLLVSVWCIGEYCDIVQARHPEKDAQTFAENIVTTVTRILSNTDSLNVKQYCLNALLKVAVRFPNVKILIIPTFDVYQSALELELQQRAWEYLQMLDRDDLSIASAAADRMPALETTNLMRESIAGSPTVPSVDSFSSRPGAQAVQPVQPPAREQPKQDNSFLDGIFGSSAKSAATDFSATATAPGGGAAPQPAATSFSLDDIFGGAGAPAPAQPPAAAVAGSSNSNAVGNASFDPFSSDLPTQSQQPPQAARFTPTLPLLGEPVEGFQNSHLQLVFYVTRPNPTSVHDVLLEAVVYNKCNTPLNDIELLAAVTRTAVLKEMHATQSDQAPVGGYAVQAMSINNNNNGSNGQQPIVIKIRLGYTPGAAAREQLEFVVKKLPNTCS